jgi:hypothetical protein
MSRDGALIVLALRHQSSSSPRREAARQPVEAADDAFELRALAPELLRPLGRCPDAGLFEFARDFLQALVLVVVIKDTPSRRAVALLEIFEQMNCA